MKRLWQVFLGLMPVGLVGGYVGLTLGILSAKLEGGNAAGKGLGMFLVGWLYCVVVVCLIRLLRVAPWAYPIVGLCAGPIPFALLADEPTIGEDTGGWLLTTALLGLVIGLIECARVAWVRRSAGPG